MKSKVNVDDFKNDQESSLFKELRSHQRKYKYDIEYETETLDYFIKKTYLPDFILTFPNGKKMYIEFKGYLRRDDERKLISIKEQHPDIDLRIVFQKNNRMYKRKMRYSDWASKHNIPWSVGTLPTEWLVEASEPEI